MPSPKITDSLLVWFSFYWRKKNVLLSHSFWGVASWLKKQTWTPYSIIQPNLGGRTVISLETNLVFRNSWTDPFDDQTNYVLNCFLKPKEKSNFCLCLLAKSNLNQLKVDVGVTYPLLERRRTVLLLLLLLLCQAQASPPGFWKVLTGELWSHRVLLILEN